MCGISGLLDLQYDDDVLHNMLLTMSRRGPDDSGIYMAPGCALLHSRLAIIDPHGGCQPMQIDWEGERYCIVYNGELYNTQQVKKDLESAGHSFTTKSDTEVVLHAFAQWKECCLERLNGIFAFGIWNEKEQSLFIARDRIGVKPLFYKKHDNGFIFASEIKTILRYPTVQAQIDQEGICQILMIGPGRIPGSGVFKDIHEIEPGCYAVYQNGQLTIKRYWQLKDAEHLDDFQQTAEQVRYLVLDAITRQMVSDVPVGTFMSGGLDSSIISAVCANVLQRTGEPFCTFSLDYENNAQYFVPGKFQPNADTEFINIMKKNLYGQHHWTVISTTNLFAALEDGTKARDLPGMADVDCSLLMFCKEIREHVKVALSGECADEIFGGYPWYRDPEVRDIDGFPWAQNMSQRLRFLHGDHKLGFDPEEYVYDHYQQTLNQCDILPDNSPLERRMKQMVNLNMRWFMQTLLDRKDRMSMYNGLEVRVPFCDYRIAEYMYHVPWEYKDYSGHEKGLLRYAMRGLLPNEILWRKKSPYPKTYDPMYLTLTRHRLRQIIDDPTSALLQIVEKQALEELLDHEYKWPWYGQLMKAPQTMAYFIQMDYWLKEYKISII